MQIFLRQYGAIAALVSGLVTVGCGGGDESASTSNISSAAPASASCNSAAYPETLGYQSLLTKYKGDTQCLTQIQNAEAMRQAAIANCSAGSTASATTQYKQYQTLVTYVKSIKCG